MPVRQHQRRQARAVQRQRQTGVAGYASRLSDEAPEHRVWPQVHDLDAGERDFVSRIRAFPSSSFSHFDQMGTLKLNYRFFANDGSRLSAPATVSGKGRGEHVCQ